MGSPLRLRIPVANPNRKVEESPGCGGVCWIPELGYMKVCGQTMKKTLLCAFTFCLCHTAFAASVITTRPDDPKAVYLDAPVANADSTV